MQTARWACGALMAAAMLGCEGVPTEPSTTPSAAPAEAGDGTAASPTGSVVVQATQWTLESIGPHYVYGWSGGPASRLTVSRISDPQAVVWEILDASGNGFGGAQGGAVAHGLVPAGARAIVDAAPGPDEAGWYRVSVALIDERDGSLQFFAYPSPSGPSCDPWRGCGS